MEILLQNTQVLLRYNVPSGFWISFGYILYIKATCVKTWEELQGFFVSGPVLQKESVL